MNEQEKQALIDHAKENVKALEMASRQSAFKEVKGSIETDLKLAEIALAALTAPPAVNLADLAPGSWKLVPIEMTDDIGEAIAMEAGCCGGIALDIYDAALRAAPEPPSC